MPAFSYVAKRELISGHSVDAVYDVDYSLIVKDRDRDTKKSESKALDGTRETILYRQKTIFTVSTRLNSTAILQWREFMASIEGGEAFIFDEYGTVAQPDNGINCRIIDSSRESRVEKLNKFDCFWKFEVI